jgi:hypothetical protein
LAVGRATSRLRPTWHNDTVFSVLAQIWFFITDWFAIHLVSKGLASEDTLLGFWIHFLAADLVNVFGGGFSSYLIRRG